jgi:hypothetical protein
MSFLVNDRLCRPLFEGSVYVVTGYFGISQIAKMYLVMSNLERNNITPTRIHSFGIATGIYSGAMLISAGYVLTLNKYLTINQVSNLYLIAYGMSFGLNVLTYFLLPKESNYSLTYLI